MDETKSPITIANTRTTQITVATFFCVFLLEKSIILLTSERIYIYMPHIPIFFIVMCVIIMVHFGISGSKRTAEKKTKSFWDREEKANAVRRQDISKLPYVELDLAALPLDAASDLDCKREINELKSLASNPEHKILNLSMYTNTDLKTMYGPANLADLSFYDENFTRLIRALNKIGTCLYEGGNVPNAQAVFEYAVSCGSDITETYVTLGEIYADAGEATKLDALIEKATQLQSLSAPTITNKLDSIKSAEK